MYIVYNLLVTITINIQKNLIIILIPLDGHIELLGYTHLHKCNIFPLENLWYTITLTYHVIIMEKAISSVNDCMS